MSSSVRMKEFLLWRKKSSLLSRKKYLLPDKCYVLAHENEKILAFRKENSFVSWQYFCHMIATQLTLETLYLKIWSSSSCLRFNMYKMFLLVDGSLHSPVLVVFQTVNFDVSGTFKRASHVLIDVIDEIKLSVKLPLQFLKIRQLWCVQRTSLSSFLFFYAFFPKLLCLDDQFMNKASWQDEHINLCHTSRV